MIKKVFSILLVFVILSFVFTPSVFAVDDDNLVDSNLSNWDLEIVNGSFSRFDVNHPGPNWNRILIDGNESLSFGMIFDVTDLISNNNYNCSFDISPDSIVFEDYAVSAGLEVIYDGKNPAEVVTGGLSHADYDDYLFFVSSDYQHQDTYNINTNFKLEVNGNRSYRAFVLFTFISAKENPRLAFVDIRNFSITEIESKETNILKRILNFVTDIKDRLMSLPSAIGSFFSDLKINMSNWFTDLKNSIGGFFDDFGDNVSEFLTTLTNCLLWFNADGESSYINPFADIENVDVERSVFGKLVDWLDVQVSSLEDFLGNATAFIMVFSTFTNGFVFVFSLCVFGLFLHIARRLLGY